MWIKSIGVSYLGTPTLFIYWSRIRIKLVGISYLKINQYLNWTPRNSLINYVKLTNIYIRRIRKVSPNGTINSHSFDICLFIYYLMLDLKLFYVNILYNIKITVFSHLNPNYKNIQTYFDNCSRSYWNFE